MTILSRVRRMPVWDLPATKRQRGRASVAALRRSRRALVGGTVCSFVVQWVMDATGFSALPGAGEPGLGMLITAYLAGYAGLLRQLLAMDLVSTRTLRDMARYACNPARLVVAHGCICRTGTRCADPRACPFGVPGIFGTLRCHVCDADCCSRPQLRQLIRMLGLKRFETVVDGGTTTFAESVLNGYLRPKRALFAANDAARAVRERNGLPTPCLWPGAEFKVREDGPYGAYWSEPVARRFPTYRVVDTRTNRKGRVAALRVYDTGGDAELTFWIRLAAQGSGWRLCFPRPTPRPMMINAGDLPYTACGDDALITIQRWPQIRFFYASAYDPYH